MSGISGCGGKQAPLALALSRARYHSVLGRGVVVVVKAWVGGWGGVGWVGLGGVGGGGGCGVGGCCVWGGSRLLQNRDWLTEQPMSITCAHQQHE